MFYQKVPKLVDPQLFPSFLLVLVDFAAGMSSAEDMHCLNLRVPLSWLISQKISVFMFVLLS